MEQKKATDEWKEYEALRKEPQLKFSEQEKCFYAANYSDVDFFLKSERVTVDFPFRASRQVFGKTILDSDDDKHLLIKRNLSAFFSKKVVDHYKEHMIRPLIRDILKECTSDDPENIDYNFLIAQRIPTQVIMKIFGIGLQHERYLFSHLEKLILYIDHPSNSLAQANEAREELLSFLRKCLTGEILVAPQGILSSLDKDLYTGEDEMLRTCLMLLTAGMATTIASLNTMLLYVYENVAYLKGIVDDIFQLRRFVEEVIRVESPLHATIRFVKEDFGHNEVDLRKNDMIKILLASANRDELKFETPDALNFSGKKDSGCTFGKGKHACIGSELAITELIVFVQELMPYIGRYEIVLGNNEAEFEGNVIKMFRKINLKKIH
jgi:cytochrome P450